ncbi:MAG TPA: hypothetical protein PKU78_06475 [Candidatus Dojkabacteria bacterium]|nr:hypothetical protein [Candidatus Dojkabacteria bacterium]
MKGWHKSTNPELDKHINLNFKMDTCSLSRGSIVVFRPTIFHSGSCYKDFNNVYLQMVFNHSERPEFVGKLGIYGGPELTNYVDHKSVKPKASNTKTPTN